MTTRPPRKRTIAKCYFCNHVLYTTPGKGDSWGWTPGDLFGEARLIPGHHKCVEAACQQIREGTYVKKTVDG